MDLCTVLLNKVVGHRLKQEDIRIILDTLSHADRGLFLDKLTDMIGKLTALIEVASQISSSLSLDTLFERLIELTTEVLDADRGTLFLNDPETNELFSRVAMGELSREIRFPNHLGIAGAVFISGEPVVIDDAYVDERFNREMDRKTGYRTRSILTAPVKDKLDEVVGVIQLLNKRSGVFTSDDLSMLEAITPIAASTLRNAQLYEQVERARREQAQLFEVTRAISSELQPCSRRS